jgi:hypothetical protein
MDTIDRIYRIPRSEIVYFNAILDSYEGIAMIRTVDRMAGIIKVFISPSFVPVFDGLIAAIDIPIVEIAYEGDVAEY